MPFADPAKWAAPCPCFPLSCVWMWSREVWAHSGYANRITDNQLKWKTLQTKRGATNAIPVTTQTRIFRQQKVLHWRNVGSWKWNASRQSHTEHNTSGLLSSTFGCKSEVEASKQTKNFPVTVRSWLVKTSPVLKLQICYCDDKWFALQSFAASREIMGYVMTLIHWLFVLFTCLSCVMKMS